MLYSSNASAQSNAPKHTILANINPNAASGANNKNLFGNTTPGAFVNNMVVGLYGVDKVQAENHAASGETKSPGLQGAGWTLVKQGMGPATAIAITAAGGVAAGTDNTPPAAIYSNNDIATITTTLGGCTINCSANVVTNPTGNVVGFTNVTNNGGLFVNVATVTVAITNSIGGTANGTGFTGTAVLGGRAGRVTKETLVVTPSMTSNGTQTNAFFPRT